MRLLCFGSSALCFLRDERQSKLLIDCHFEPDCADRIALLAKCIATLYNYFRDQIIPAQGHRVIFLDRQ